MQEMEQRSHIGRGDDGQVSAARHRILLVDDDMDTLGFGMEALLWDGCDVQCATNGVDGLALALDAPPDVVVVDLKMPRMSGQELCDAVRRTPSLERTRILIVSGAHDARSVAADYDADGVVTKPFTSALLRHHVRRLLGV